MAIDSAFREVLRAKKLPHLGVLHEFILDCRRRVVARRRPEDVDAVVTLLHVRHVQWQLTEDHRTAEVIVLAVHSPEHTDRAVFGKDQDLLVDVRELVALGVDADEVVVPLRCASALTAPRLDQFRHGRGVEVALVDEVRVVLRRYRSGLSPVMAGAGANIPNEVEQSTVIVLLVLDQKSVYFFWVVLRMEALVEVGGRVVAARAPSRLGRSPHVPRACEIVIRVVELDRPRHVVDDGEPRPLAGYLGLEFHRDSRCGVNFALVEHQVFHREPDVLDGHRVAVRPSRATTIREGVFPAVVAHLPALDETRLACANRVAVDQARNRQVVERLELVGGYAHVPAIHADLIVGRDDPDVLVDRKSLFKREDLSRPRKCRRLWRFVELGRYRAVPLVGGIIARLQLRGLVFESHHGLGRVLPLAFGSCWCSAPNARSHCGLRLFSRPGWCCRCRLLLGLRSRQFHCLRLCRSCRRCCWRCCRCRQGLLLLFRRLTRKGSDRGDDDHDKRQPSHIPKYSSHENSPLQKVIRISHSKACPNGLPPLVAFIGR